ncbi:MAG: response regulator [Bryobacteraceae bacterium]|nr:response regulator [Bryobacteraceae bacterium]
MPASMRVLLVDDNPVDVRLLQEALAAQCQCEFVVRENGDEAYTYLEAEGRTVDLIVLDLNVPGKDGGDVLRLIRRTEHLRTAFVAVVSSSPKDVVASRAAEADCYLTKPLDLDEYARMGAEILDCYRSRGQARARGGAPC